ncbi:MAG: OmpA family protein [Deltaproteobacteria bacterium]|nr:OmpA family protein [Deltaproteobacteria bacterium]
MKLRSWIVATSLVFGSGCLMRTSTHESAMAKAKTAHDEKVADLDKQIADLTKMRDALQTEIDAQTTLLADLKGRLERLGQNVDSLTKDNAEAAARLEELRKQKAAADARLATFKSLLSKLQSMIDSKQLKVVIRDGRMIIALPNDILFDSGKTSVKKEGKDALEKVAQVLATVADRDFLVAGHTDNVPIKTGQFPSNWELSAARAVEVVRFLVSKGMDGKVLAAAGFAEFDPVVANDNDGNRAQNRRIEIVLQPNIGDLPNLDELTK